MQMNELFVFRFYNHKHTMISTKFLITVALVASVACAGLLEDLGTIPDSFMILEILYFPVPRYRRQFGGTQKFDLGGVSIAKSDSVGPGGINSGSEVKVNGKTAYKSKTAVGKDGVEGDKQVNGPDGCQDAEDFIWGYFAELPIPSFIL
jgi:hypothetical protein